YTTKKIRRKTDKTITKKSVKEIKIQPLNTIEQLDNYSDEKVKQMIQAVREGKANDEWTVAQQSYAETGELFLKQLQDSLEKGNESVVYDGNKQIARSEERRVGK